MSLVLPALGGAAGWTFASKVVGVRHSVTCFRAHHCGSRMASIQLKLELCTACPTSAIVLHPLKLAKMVQPVVFQVDQVRQLQDVTPEPRMQV
jgi:hypothetical protein